MLSFGFRISVGVGGFVIGLGQISFFFSSLIKVQNLTKSKMYTSHVT